MDEENNKIIELAYLKKIESIIITRPSIDYGYNTLEININNLNNGIDKALK